jgi:hypothetical protein
VLSVDVCAILKDFERSWNQNNVKILFKKRSKFILIAYTSLNILNRRE